MYLVTCGHALSDLCAKLIDLQAPLRNIIMGPLTDMWAPLRNMYFCVQLFLLYLLAIICLIHKQI